MKEIVFTLVLVFVSLGCSIEMKAQGISDVPSNSFPFNLSGRSIMTYDNRYEGVKGTYTFLEEFMPGTVELKKGKFTDVLINYDAYTDNLLAKNDKINETVQMRKDMVINFVLKKASGVEYTFSKESINGVPTFLLNLVQDTISLYCRIRKTIVKADLGGAYNTSEKKFDEFVTENTFYVFNGSGDLREIQKSKKGILQAFPEFNDQLSAYLKQNKIDFKSLDHMKLLIKYVNTLYKKNG